MAKFSKPLHPDSEYFIKVITPSEIAILDVAAFFSFLTEYQLWEVYVRHLQLQLSVAMDHTFKLLPPVAYDVVRIQLFELMQEPDEIRCAVKAEEYIRGKTRLSRSRIMAVLSDLKRGGYIQITKGLLMGIDRIPKEY